MPSSSPSWDDLLRMMEEQNVDDPGLVLGAYGDDEEWKPVPDFPVTSSPTVGGSRASRGES